MQKTLAWLIAAGLAVVFSRPAQADTLAELWNSGLQNASQGHPDEAARAFQQWIDLAEKSGLRSSEAHHNLGYLYWTLKRPGPAIYHSLTSAILSGSLPKTLDHLQALSSMEREVGIKDGVSSHLAFRLRILFGENTLTFLLAAGFWALILVVLMRLVRFPGSKVRTLKPVFLAIAAVAWSLAAAGIAQRYLLPTQYGVLDNEKGAIAVFRLPEQKADEKLVDLPSGTIVSVGHSENDGFVKIVYPVSGWVQTAEVQQIRGGG
jgi:hypothetical protein